MIVREMEFKMERQGLVNIGDVVDVTEREGFNYSYIFGCLNALGHEKEITLELTEGRPGVFKSYDKINYIYLVMPVRV